MQVREAVDEFYAAKKNVTTWKTLNGYKTYLEGFVAWCEEKELELEDLKATHIREFIAYQQERKPHRGERMADWTIHHYAGIIRTFLKWCQRDEDFGEFVQKKLGDRVEMPKVRDTLIETLTDDEIKALLKAAAQQPFPSLRARDKAILLVLLDTGARASELFLDPARPAAKEPTGLRVDNLQLRPDDSYIKVFGKGRKERECGLGSQSRKALAAYLRVRQPAKEDCPYAFLNRSGEPLTINGLDQLLKRLGTSVGVEGIHAHKFRHTFACNYLLHGGDLYTLSRLLGHTSVKMTEKYLRAINVRQARSKNISVSDRLRSTGW